MIRGSCHCGAIRFEYHATPEWLTACNCSICRRSGAQWAYETRDKIVFHFAQGATERYVWGDRTLAFVRCRNCGCLTHWESLDPQKTRMGVNCAMADPEDIAGIRVRLLDGADSWKFLD